MKNYMNIMFRIIACIIIAVFLILYYFKIDLKIISIISIIINSLFILMLDENNNDYFVRDSIFLINILFALPNVFELIDSYSRSVNIITCLAGLVCIAIAYFIVRFNKSDGSIKAIDKIFNTIIFSYVISFFLYYIYGKEIIKFFVSGLMGIVFLTISISSKIHDRRRLGNIGIFVFGCAGSGFISSGLFLGEEINYFFVVFAAILILLSAVYVIPKIIFNHIRIKNNE